MPGKHGQGILRAGQVCKMKRGSRPFISYVRPYVKDIQGLWFILSFTGPAFGGLE